MDTLEALLRNQGREVVRTREPGGTPLAEKLRALFLHDSMDALTETLLVSPPATRSPDSSHSAGLGPWRLGHVRSVHRRNFYLSRRRPRHDKQVLQTLESWVQEQRQPV